eukprot:gene1223-32564_t
MVFTFNGQSLTDSMTIAYMAAELKFEDGDIVEAKAMDIRFDIGHFGPHLSSPGAALPSSSSADLEGSKEEVVRVVEQVWRESMRGKLISRGGAGGRCDSVLEEQQDPQWHAPSQGLPSEQQRLGTLSLRKAPRGQKSREKLYKVTATDSPSASLDKPHTAEIVTGKRKKDTLDKSLPEQAEAQVEVQAEPQGTPLRRSQEYTLTRSPYVERDLGTIKNLDGASSPTPPLGSEQQLSGALKGNRQDFEPLIIVTDYGTSSDHDSSIAFGHDPSSPLARDLSNDVTQDPSSPLAPDSSFTLARDLSNDFNCDPSIAFGGDSSNTVGRDSSIDFGWWAAEGMKVHKSKGSRAGESERAQRAEAKAKEGSVALESEGAERAEVHESEGLRAGESEVAQGAKAKEEEGSEKNHYHHLQPQPAPAAATESQQELEPSATTEEQEPAPAATTEEQDRQIRVQQNEETQGEHASFTDLPLVPLR